MAGFSNRMKKQQRQKAKKRETKDEQRTSLKSMVLRELPGLAKIAPTKGYSFHSDYFEIDNGFATIMTVFFNRGAGRNLPPMWGLRLIPKSLGTGKGDGKVTARLITQVNRLPDGKFEEYQKNADTHSRSEKQSASQSDNRKQQTLSQYNDADRSQIAADQLAGDSYMHVSFKVMIKAESLEMLDKACDRLRQYYNQLFSGMYTTQFQGQQRDDLVNYFEPAEKQLGHNFMFTSSELAGEYNVVTRGLTDYFGEYVGRMRGELVSSGMLWDIDAWKDHVVVASNHRAEVVSPYKFPKGTRGANMWGVKIAQSALINGHRVVHLILDGSQINKIGQDLSDITTVVGMNSGAINPFEIFGNSEDELTAYAANAAKLRLMAQQIDPKLSPVDLTQTLGKTIENFYIDMGMWKENAQKNRQALRVTGLAHPDYPKLSRFVAYLRQQREQYSKQGDMTRVNSVDRITATFDLMLSENGDIFDVITNRSIDKVNESPQVIYDFSSLLRRGTNIAMAQLINALGFSIGSLREGDVVLVHGLEELTPAVKTYMKNQFRELRKRDVRVAYLYDDTAQALSDHEFNGFSEADYTLLGAMSQNLIDKYNKEVMHQELPQQLTAQINDKNNGADAALWFLRRGLNNLIFKADPILESVDSQLDQERVNTRRGKHTGRILIKYKGKKNRI